MTLYDGRDRESWIEELSRTSDWNKRHFLTAVSLLGLPATMLDVGCGDGTVQRAAHSLGIEAYGVDQLVQDGTIGGVNINVFMFHANLVDKFVLPKPVEMVWCTEVAEHLDPSAHSTLCDTCVDNLAEGREHYLVFSSAFPNQGGSEHLSERPARYWLDQFSLRGLNFRKNVTVSLSMLWSNIGSPLYWLANNVMVFEK